MIINELDESKIIQNVLISYRQMTKTRTKFSPSKIPKNTLEPNYIYTIDTHFYLSKIYLEFDTDRIKSLSKMSRCNAQNILIIRR